MARNAPGSDQLFLKAEQLANDFSLFRQTGKLSRKKSLKGILTEKVIDRILKQLQKLEVDQYIKETVLPTEVKSRPGAKTVIKKIGGRIIKETNLGPLYSAEVELIFPDSVRRVGFLTQERSLNNGAWMPEHHLRAVDVIREFSEYSIPIVTLIDTPGADAGEIANRNNQAHCISRLIAEMALLDVPTVGIILGNGYSGGAIPLATTNILLSVRDGVFNTIQPRGLASIARKYNLSWQECAKYVGVSSYELYKQGYIDGIIDFVPGEDEEKLSNLKNAICSSVLSIENSVKDFTVQNPYVFNHYKRSVNRYLTPSKKLSSYEKQSIMAQASPPSSQANIFGITTRYLRYLTLRNRICSTTIQRYGRLSEQEIPVGDLGERIEKEHKDAFQQWLGSPLEVKYDSILSKSWKDFQYFKSHLKGQRGKFRKLILGDPKKNFEKSIKNLNLCFGFHLYNLWKTGAQSQFQFLSGYLDSNRIDSSQSKGNLSVLDVITDVELRSSMVRECKIFIIFDLIYDNIIDSLLSIAKEAKESNTVSKESIKVLLEDSLSQAFSKLLPKGPKKDEGAASHELELRSEFLSWLDHFIHHPKRNGFLKSVEEWKKIAYPRVSEPLFAIITFLFEHLLPNYFQSQNKGKTYDGSINFRTIGMKDFWNRLTIAYHDLLIQDILFRLKKARKVTPANITKKYLREFKELRENLMTSDPVNFPGFRISIEEALTKGIKPCGTVAGIGKFKADGVSRKVGVIISKLDFQAGAFDMASAEKVCQLMVECSSRRCPIIAFISSGGMQTKEGAGALFSMAIVNDRITRFVRDNDLPIICFGFGDCTGGAQASLVTHPLVQTYYFSGTNMPFAGQIVVPSYLPTTSTLSNYLSTLPGAMQGLVKHPFFENLDQELKDIDPNIPIACETVEEVITRILKGNIAVEDPEDAVETSTVSHLELLKPVKRVLIHARGCTAVKLVRMAQKHGINVVLVQSDADMDSVAAGMLNDSDTLVCLGGNTSDESYLNALSVVRIAEREKVDSLHPGIGFLSENPQFSRLCRNHKLNFIGPPVQSMELMGNKSNAIHTAQSLKVPVVPGSHGIITSSKAALSLADRIGYPIVIKAVHGGGGKGIRMVYSSENFHEIFAQMMAEAKNSFGNSDVYIEKCITSLRHVEVQVLRDSLKNTKILGLRDCSVQRNNQKIIEESGSTLLPETLKNAVFDYSASIADKVEYVGAGTVEFIYDLKEKSIYFMEMNTRLQVEHPVTEIENGIDIVGAQFDIASGKSIANMKPSPSKYAMEVRINAEKVELDSSGDLTFIPDPGEITAYRFPKRKQIDIISTVEKNKVVPSYYDSMIMQIIGYGESRLDTIDLLLDYLESVKIQGICTNIPLLKEILKDDIFRSGEYDTTFLQHFFKRIDGKLLIKKTREFAGESKKSLNLEQLRIENSDELKVLSPSSGIFYTTPSPSEPGFIKEGDTCTIDQTLCLIEAMKVFRPITLSLFNEETSPIYSPDTKFRVVRINPVNGQAVNSGDLLFVIRPI